MLTIFEYIMYILTCLFYIYITFLCINYIVRSLFFIKPMCNKYKIMASDLSNDIKGRYPYILISLLTISSLLYITYAINFYLFIFLIFAYTCDIYFLIKKYQKFDLLHYINEFSEDLFDWEKIYNLYISEDIKKQCFQIHYLDYDEFEKHYLEKLKYKQSEIEKKMKKDY